MSRFVHVEYPTQHPGIARAERAAETVKGFQATQAVLHALAFLGAPVARLADRARSAYAGWAEQRRLAEQDRQMWEVALRDARVMADLSRAMSAEALDSLKKYY